MFETWSARPEPGPAAGAAGPEALRTGGSLVERVGAMVPGASLAEVVERLLAAAVPPLPAGTGPEAVADESALLSFFDAVIDPGEEALLRAAGAPENRGLAGAGVEELSGLGAEVLSEMVAACGRLASWASWAQALMAAALARCPELCPGPAQWGPRGEEGRAVTAEETRFAASCEIACRLGVSRAGARRLVERGQGLASPVMAPVEGLHRAGLIDESKASLVVRRLAGVDPEVAGAVQARVLPRAAHRTRAQLAGDVDRALTALDSDGAQERRRRNIAERHVSRPRPAGLGVHEMRMVLPTPDSFLLDATLDAVAASARATGDERSLSQLRADALVAMSLTTLRGAQQAACHPGNRPVSTPGHDRDGAAHQATCAVEPCPGPDAAGLGPGCAGPGGVADDSGELLPDGVPLTGLLTALSDLVGSTSPWWMPSGTSPVALPPGLRIEVDVTVPLDYLTQALEDDPPPARAAAPDQPPGRGRPPAPDRARDGNADPERDLTALEARLTVGGRSAPVPAVMARALAAGGTWRRIVTDPLTGAVIDVGRTRYRPPAALADAVRARDASCTHPGCQVPARRCDLDHVFPWAEGGRTSLDNLTCLCEAHHRLKHTPGWSLTRTRDGVLRWRTPTGARYERHADGTVIMLPRRLGPRSLALPARQVPAHLASALDAGVLHRIERGLALAPTGPRGHRPRLETRGPRPGRPIGAFETTPFPQALHDLGLAALLETVVPF